MVGFTHVALNAPAPNHEKRAVIGKVSSVPRSLFLCAAFAIFCNLLGGCDPFPSQQEQLREAEAELSAAKSELERFYALASAAKLSFEVGEFDAARKYSDELLALAPKFERDWNYGNAIHDGNMVLGRLAVHSGQVAEGKKYLLLAGATPGSPQLDSFGPNMSLAKDLIELGERESVLQYFDLCKKFWDMERGRLGQWAQQVRAGDRPDFEANLLY
jgi:hypothetical protein